MSQESQVSVSRKYMSGTRLREESVRDEQITEDNAGFDASVYV